MPAIYKCCTPGWLVVSQGVDVRMAGGGDGCLEWLEWIMCGFLELFVSNIFMPGECEIVFQASILGCWDCDVRIYCHEIGASR